jgi:hypothetical protein
MRKTVYLVGFFFVAMVARANDIYITQSGTGAGTSCSSPQNVAFFNNAANWGTGKPIAPGTTVHLCGTFTGTPGQQLLVAQGSGASGNPITIKFESGAVLTAPYWSSMGAIYENGRSFITIDGGTNGLIENTANGTSPTFQFQQQSRAIYAGSCTGCVVQNITIANIYVHTSQSDTAIDQTAVNCVFSNLAANFTINNMTCHDTGWAIAGFGSNSTIESSNIYNVDHGIACGASGTLSGFSIHDNHFHDYIAWDTGAADRYHHDGVHLWGQNNSIVKDGVIYNNVFDGDSGACCTTAHIFLQDSIQNVVAFNNAILVPSNLSIQGIELAGPTQQPTWPLATNNAAYNNFITDGQHFQNGGAALFARDQTNFTAENNVLIGGQADISVVEGGSLSTIDYNLYDDLKADFGDLNAFHYQNSPSTSSFSTWQSECHCDAHSLMVPASQINADSTGHLQSGSKGIGLGTNLTSIATGMLAPLAKNKDGSPRPATGRWNVGAY